MKLDDWMREHRWRNREMARELGIGDAHMGQIRQGMVRPSLQVMAKLQAFTEGQVTAIDIEASYVGRPKADAALAAA